MRERQDQGKGELAELYDRHGAKVYGYLLLMLSSHAETEDAMQEVFCRIWERQTAGHTIDNPVGYLFRAAHNEACSRLRRPWRQWVRFGVTQEPDCMLEPSDSSTNAAEDREAVAHALLRNEAMAGSESLNCRPGSSGVSSGVTRLMDLPAMHTK